MATYLEKFKQASMLNRRSFMKAGAAATVALAGGSLVACSPAAEQTDEHGQQYGDDQSLLHAARKREQPGRRDRSDQHPVAPL